MLLLLPLLALALQTPTVHLRIDDVDSWDPGRIGVSFKSDAPLVTLGEGEFTGLLDSTPALPWRCVFEDEFSVSCETDELAGLPPSSRLELRIAPGVLIAQDGRPVGGLVHSLLLRPVELKAVVLDLDARGLPDVVLRSDQRLVAASLDQRVLLRQGEREWPLALRELDAADRAALVGLRDEPWRWSRARQLWTLNWPAALQPGQPVELIARAGIAVEGGALPSDVDQHLLRWTPPATLQLRIECQYPYQNVVCTRDGPLQLKANTRPDARTLAELAAALPAGLRLSDAAPILNQQEDDGTHTFELAWSVTADAPGHRYALAIPAHWRGGLGQPMADTELLFTSGPLAPRVTIHPGLLVLPLGSPAPEQRLHWANVPGFDLLLRSLGDSDTLPLIERRLRPPGALRERNARLPPPPTQLPRRGGTQWGALRPAVDPNTTPRSAALPLDNAEFGRAWADLGLHALVFEDTIQVVGTDLYSAAPVQDIRIDWLLQHPQLRARQSMRRQLAQGQTDAGGQLDIRNDAATALASTVIRARREGRSTVLPLQASTLLERSGGWLGYAHPQRAFTWTDRITYRPGDTVQLRVLVRTPQPRALAPPPAGQRQWRLQLQSEWPQQTLDELPLALDDFGAASVQWPVPAGARDGRVLVQLLAPDGTVDTGRTAAFLVASVDAAALDVALQLPEGAVTPANLPLLSFTARYFSGGAAVAVDSRISGLLDVGDAALRAHFAEYRFGSDPDAADDAADRAQLQTQAGCFAGAAGHGYDVSVGIDQALGRTDSAGRSQARLQLVDFACPLGELKLTPVARIPGQADAYGVTQRRVFSRDPILLGLRAPAWASPGEHVDVGAVAVRIADLTALPQRPLQIVIERKEGERWSERQRCQLGGPSAARCDWQPQQAGDWRLRLSADGASSIKQAVTVWGDAVRDPRVELRAPPGPLLAGRSATYALRQPYAAARVLLTVESDGLLHQQWHAVDRPQVELPLTIHAAWAPCFHVAVLVVPQVRPGQPLQPTLADVVSSCVAVPRPTLVDLTVQPLQCSPAPPACEPLASAAAARPGSWIRVGIRSRHDQPLRLSLTGIDAAMLDFDPELRSQRDPHGTPFLQRENPGKSGQTYSLLAWAKPPDPDGSDLLFGSGKFLVSLGGHSRTAADAWTMDRVEVVGSRIEREDAETTQPVLVIQSEEVTAFAQSRSRTRERDASNALRSRQAARIPRQRFADTAFWLPDEPLQAGASRQFDLQLPDNLTRWEIEVLAVDAADQFQLASAAVEAGLPLEARVLAPARVFVGDRAVLGAQLRNSSPVARRVRAGLTLSGTADPIGLDRPLDLAPASSHLLQRPWQARAAGDATVLARLEDRLDGTGDAVIKPIQIQSTLAPWTQRQTGLLLQSPTVLDLSRVLPAGAPADLRVQLGRNPLFGLAGLFEQARDYPHRCLEQRLSRALVAHHARSLSTLASTDLSWATQAVIDEPLANLARYRSGDNGLVFFNPDYETADPQLQVYALLVLAELGQRLPDAVHEHAIQTAAGLIEALAPKPVAPATAAARTPIPAPDANAAAFALRALATLQLATPAQVQRLLDPSVRLSAWGSSQLLHALAGNPAFTGQRRQLLERVRGLGEHTAGRIRLRRPDPQTVHGRDWLHSDPRDACAVLDALLAADDGHDAHAEHAAWLYGLFDAYGSDLAVWDTQTLATCSSAAARYARRWLTDAPAVPVQLMADARTLLDLPLDLQAPLSVQQTLAPTSRPTLTVHADTGQDVVYSVALRQQRDRMTLPAAAQGLALDRQAEVWRGGQWLPVPQAVVRVGDWVRVRLVLTTRRAVSMVAISDSVPGGLRAINKSLEGVSDAQVQQSDEGSFWFFERQLSATDARLYATSLPAGRHEVFYYTQARHAGHYAWPGASAELMYNLQHYGRSAAAVLEIEAVDSD